MNAFTVGTPVKWISSSNGSTKEKHGVIEAITLKGSDLTKEQREELRGAGRPRDHESYLVRCGKTKTAKGKLYWPRVSALLHDNGAG